MGQEGYFYAMKGIFKITLIVFSLTFVLNLQAQDVSSLIKEGIQLGNTQNYAGAIEKYKAALKLEPNNPSANYQIAFSLNASGKGREALPYLQKVVQSESSIAVISSSYELMGTIYDQSAQPQKAIESYQQGIKVDSASYSLRYNLGLVYFRNRQYAQAEKNAIEAIKINPKHSGSMRLYALVSFHQDKRAAALLGFCSFLWLEPNSNRSAEAYGNIQHILKGGALKAEPGEMKPHSVDANTYALNQAITQAVVLVAKRRNLLPADQFSEQLQAIFTAVGALAKKQGSNDFFHAQLAEYYYQLAQSANVPAFAHLIRQSADKTASAWLRNHQQQVAALDNWVKAAKP